jgi:molybdopterin-containing oxidoreductase family membrane subunit
MNGSTTVPDVIRGEASSSVEHPLSRVPLVLNQRNFSWITERIAGVIEGPAPRWWWVSFAVSALVAAIGLFCLGYQIATGVGVWGLNHPVGWAWDITNFVFWIGIGHAGTLISAILFLLRQKWRTSINRAAEAMTLFAVICAAIFPACTSAASGWRGSWRRCRITSASGRTSAARCLWDVFAVSTYFSVSVLFWYTG